MHAHELQALRRHLNLSADEAARWIAQDSARPQGVEPRTWNRWESGRVPVPGNISARVLELAAVARQIRHQLQAAAQAQHTATGQALAVPWYVEADDAPFPGLHWRIDQAGKAAALAELGADVLHLVAFDGRAFRAWRIDRGLDDGPEARQAWACAVDAAPVPATP